MFGTFNSTDVFGQASEEFFLGGSGLKLKLYGGAGSSTPSGPLAQIGYDGQTRVFGGLLTYPLLRSREQNLNLTAAFDATESNVLNNEAPGGITQRASFDSLRVLRFGADYALLDNWLGSNRTGLNSANVKLSQGLTILGASTNNEIVPQPPRAGEKINFTKFGGQVSRNQTLFEPYDNATVALYGAIGGQYTNELLPPSEKYYLGGPTFNRGFYYGQVSGDKAVTVSVELRLNTPIPMPSRVPFEVKSQFYLFYDWGGVWQNAPATLEANATLRSAGTGVRLFAGPSTEIDLEGVYRITLYPNGQANESALTSAAFYWQVVQHF
jgi:hemolysin activation/secretion protein